MYSFSFRFLLSFIYAFIYFFLFPFLFFLSVRLSIISVVAWNRAFINHTDKQLIVFCRFVKLNSSAVSDCQVIPRSQLSAATIFFDAVEFITYSVVCRRNSPSHDTAVCAEIMLYSWYPGPRIISYELSILVEYVRVRWLYMVAIKPMPPAAVVCNKLYYRNA